MGIHNIATVLATLLILPCLSYATGTLGWKSRCGAILYRIYEQRDPRFRIHYNEAALRQSLPIITSEKKDFMPIPFDQGLGAFGWMHTLKKNSVELILDSNLPMWREDGDWYFE